METKIKSYDTIQPNNNVVENKTNGEEQVELPKEVQRAYRRQAFLLTYYIVYNTIIFNILLLKEGKRNGKKTCY